MQRLTDKQRRFCLEYLANGHIATEAARAAGYPKKSAHVTGSRLLTNPRVQEFLATRGAAAAAKVAQVEEVLELSAQRVLTETMRIAYADPRKLYGEQGFAKKPGEWTDAEAAMVAGYEPNEFGVKIKLWPKLQALEMLGKHLKLWTEVVEHRLDGMDLQEKAERAAALIAAALARKGIAA